MRNAPDVLDATLGRAGESLTAKLGRDFAALDVEILAEGFDASPALVDALQQHVRGQLAPYEYPKEIEFIDALPMTTTGKVQRRVLRLRELERVKPQA
ncbi:AMP-binding enzyme [Denitromonas iodatirespirans]|uniref:AMP-binding enzyme C-terminal domain-containing protein n=1 Tax=Denitromonas iodatirespirans TaxID=2795389 RepID=A0A944D754_DENI1|nr:hypothetical protein [Denitromonas iodatirespirans]MBT0959742.1 hypothetical protein [Denitromonas iodatirespirans]